MRYPLHTLNKHRYSRFALLLLSLTLLLTACGEDSEPDTPAEVLDNRQEVLDYYAANPDFFRFKTAADLPADLLWQDGSQLLEIGSDKAVKGATEYGRIADFPRTLRLVGPDSNGSFRGHLQDNVSLSLAHRHPNQFDFYPGLAQQWAIDTDTRTVYVKLNPAARWSDGQPIRSDDFLFMFFFYQSPYIVAPWYNNFYKTKYSHIARFDELTFAISVPEAKPDLDSRVLELTPVPQHFYRELGEDFVDRYQWRFQPTSGAYIIKPSDIKKGSSIAFTRQQDWWAKDLKFWKNRFNVDRVHLAVVRDTAKHFETFKRGDVDRFSLDLAQYWYDKLADSDPDVAAGYIHKTQFYNQRPRPTWGLWINSSKPLLDNRDIRIGINYASNWDLVIAKFFRGDYSRLHSAQEGYGAFSHPRLRARSFDIEQAQSHFAKAGFDTRGGDGILVNSAGQRLSFTLSSGYERYRDVFTLLKEEALKAGLDLKIEILDSTAGFKKASEKQHEIHFVAFNVGLEMYPRFWDFYHSDNAYNQAFLSDGTINPERTAMPQTNNLELFADSVMDKKITAYRASSDIGEMQTLAHEMIAMHHHYASFVPGFYQPFYRIGHWRWVRYPEGFNYKYSSASNHYNVHWIDQAIKQETLQARKEGTAFDPQIILFEQFK
jgi:microcin C transport system substrate-binding protein